MRNLQNDLVSLSTNEKLAIQTFAGLNMSAYKLANQSVTSSIVVVADDTLWTELPPGPNRVTMIVPLSMAAAGNIRLQFTLDQGLTVQGNTLGMQAIFLLDATAPSVQSMATPGVSINGGATSAWSSILITGTVNVTNPGVLQLRWAQQASSATPTIVLAGASLDTVELT